MDTLNFIDVPIYIFMNLTIFETYGHYMEPPLSFFKHFLLRKFALRSDKSHDKTMQPAGLLVLTGRPVNRPAGRPAKTIVLAGQKWPKLNISRNMHDFA